MIQDLDHYFPFIVLFYGFIMTLVTQMPLLKRKLQEEGSHEMLQWFYSHQLLGQVCLFVGALWSLQKLLI